MGKQKFTVDTVAMAATETAAKNNQKVEIPRDRPITRIDVRHSGTYTIATADSSALVDGGLLNLFTNFRLVGGGKDYLVSGVDSRFNLYRCNHYEGQDLDNNTTLAVTAAAYTIRYQHSFYFGMPNPNQVGKHPLYQKSVLIPARYKSLNLYWDEPNLSQASTPAGTTALSIAGNTEVIIHTMDEPTGEEVLVPMLAQEAVDYTATGRQKFELDDGNLLRHLSVFTRNAGALSDATIADLLLELKVKGQLVRPESRNEDTVADDIERLTGLAHQTGQHFVWLDDEGDGSDIIDTDLGELTQADFKPNIDAVGSGVRDMTVLIERYRSLSE